MDVPPPLSSHRILVTLDEDADMSINSRMRFAEECIETKTVTTTTRTKRAFPPFTVPEPRGIHALDPKNYPLAKTPTPPELRKFSFSLDHVAESWAEDEVTDAQVSSASILRGYIC